MHDVNINALLKLKKLRLFANLMCLLKYKSSDEEKHTFTTSTNLLTKIWCVLHVHVIKKSATSYNTCTNTESFPQKCTLLKSDDEPNSDLVLGKKIGWWPNLSQILTQLQLVMICLMLKCTKFCVKLDPIQHLIWIMITFWVKFYPQPSSQSGAWPMLSQILTQMQLVLACVMPCQTAPNLAPQLGYDHIWSQILPRT